MGFKDKVPILIENEEPGCKFCQIMVKNKIQAGHCINPIVLKDERNNGLGAKIISCEHCTYKKLRKGWK